MVKYLILFCSFSVIIGNAFAQTLVIDTVCFNTNSDDYGIRKFGNELLFVSSAKAGEDGTIPTDEVTKLPFSDLFVVDKCSQKEIKLKSNTFTEGVGINSSLNDGPISVSSSGNLFFFTNNSNSKTNKLGIFYSTLVDGGWIAPVAFPLNNDAYNVTHPFFDEQTKRLYFATDMDKVKGAYDLYYSVYNGIDWGRPISLSGINSDSSECFPFIYNDKIYFTSNNSKSLGGLDLFVFENGVVTNLGEGMNSIYDDLAITPTSDTSGYFSSNRNSLGVQDDIYTYFYEPLVVVVEVVPVIEEIIPIKVNELANVFFGFDLFSIKESEVSKLQEVVRLMLDEMNLYIVVSGHTDNKGSSDYNLALSEKRALSVKKFLVNNGITANRIVIEFNGLSKPSDSNATVEGRAKNRRVEFKILKEL